MRWKGSIARITAACVAALLAGALGAMQAQQPPSASQSDPGAARDAQGGSGADLGYGLFAAADANTDGAVTKAEFRETFEKWFSTADTGRTGAVAEAELLAALKLPQPRLPFDSHVQAMLAALPDRAAARPSRPRKVLVFNRCGGFIHTPIPLVARMIETFGNRTKAWSTTITYDAADINAQNLKQYDALVLNSNTGAFLDDPNDRAATDARKKALIEFVRGGKGLVGIHASTDAYHTTTASVASAARGGRGGGGGQRGAGPTLTTQSLLQGDKNSDQKLSKAEMGALADAWFARLDTDSTASVRQAEFIQRLTAAMAPAPAAPAAGGARSGGAPTAPQGRDTRVGTWPDYNRMIGAIFKYHFNNQPITVRVEDPKSPLTAMFKRPLELTGEIYTFSMDTYSRENLRVLTSVDYSKMSEADRARESYPRSDQDYPLSWIRRDGSGRVFYTALGNEEKTFFLEPINEQLLAGVQYALGDLKADDTPSRRPGTK
jgi:type 1 glutamine amidotransferase